MCRHVGMCVLQNYTYSAVLTRVHVFVRSETRDANGRVVGSYQYLDPLKRIVKVDYTADSSGFYPTVQGAVPDALPKVRQGEEGRGRGEGLVSNRWSREPCPTLCPR